MTLNIMFFTITIKKRIKSTQEYLNYEMMKKIEEENRNRQVSLYRMF